MLELESGQLAKPIQPLLCAFLAFELSIELKYFGIDQKSLPKPLKKMINETLTTVEKT
jgi:hypothetical protein